MFNCIVRSGDEDFCFTPAGGIFAGCSGRLSHPTHVLKSCGSIRVRFVHRTSSRVRRDAPVWPFHVRCCFPTSSSKFSFCCAVRSSPSRLARRTTMRVNVRSFRLRSAQRDVLEDYEIREIAAGLMPERVELRHCGMAEFDSIFLGQCHQHRARADQSPCAWRRLCWSCWRSSDT